MHMVVSAVKINCCALINSVSTSDRYLGAFLGREMWQNNKVSGIQCCQNNISEFLFHSVLITVDFFLMGRQKFVEMSE